MARRFRKGIRSSECFGRSSPVLLARTIVITTKTANPTDDWLSTVEHSTVLPGQIGDIIDGGKIFHRTEGQDGTLILYVTK